MILVEYSVTKMFPSYFIPSPIQMDNSLLKEQNKENEKDFCDSFFPEWEETLTPTLEIYSQSWLSARISTVLSAHWLRHHGL